MEFVQLPSFYSHSAVKNFEENTDTNFVPIYSIMIAFDWFRINPFTLDHYSYCLKTTERSFNNEQFLLGASVGAKQVLIGALTNTSTDVS